MTDNFNGQYFDDMWLAFEQELSQYDSFIGDHDWMNSDSGGNMSDQSVDPNEESNLSPDTYEDLIEQLNNKKTPSREQLRSKSREERIEAVRELYNQMPSIVNASSLARLHRVANSLYKAGRVKQANQLLRKTAEVMETHFTYQKVDDDKVHKRIDISINGDDQEAYVEIIDNTGEDTIEVRKKFNNILEAIKFYLNPDYKE